MIKKELEGILDTLLEFKQINSTNAKIEKLKQLKDNELFKETIKLMYSPHISTNLSSKKINKQIEQTPLLFNTLMEFYTFLSTECTGKDSDISKCKAVINLFEDEKYKELLKEVIGQNLSLGIDIKTINKAIPNLIYFIEPMLATNIHNINEQTLKDKEIVLTQKYDGNRMLLKYGKDEKIPFSRNSLILEGYDNLISKYQLKEGYYYDGELLYIDNTLSSEERFKKTSEITRSKGEKRDLIYVIFDMIPIIDFEKGSCTLSYIERRNLLDSLVSNEYSMVAPILYKGEYNSKKVFELLDKVVENKEEGLMLNTFDNLYENGKRSKTLLKLKKFNDVDVKVIDVLQGTGKYKNKLGNIVVDYKGYEVGVGSGFSDSLREYYFKNQDEIIGKIVKIKYFEESSDKEGNLSLRFPVFIEIRDDKTEASYD